MPKKHRGKGKHKRSLKVKQLRPGQIEPQFKQVTTIPRVTTLTKPAITEPEIGERYHYVINDLRRIAIIAGVLFLLLIALSFFLK